jgi:hypothetical protein
MLSAVIHMGVNLRKVVLISFLYDALVRSFGARVMWYRMFCGSIFVVDHNKANSDFRIQIYVKVSILGRAEAAGEDTGSKPCRTAWLR